MTFDPYRTEAETVSIDRETLSELRYFADNHCAEYGNPDLCHAILDAGLALDLQEPVPSTPPEQMDLEAFRSWDAFSDEEIDGYVERYEEYRNSE